MWAFFSCYTERIKDTERMCIRTASGINIIHNDRNDMTLYRIRRACRGGSHNGLGDFLLSETQVGSWGFGLL